jgi:glycosyltransferase involved in cell wall biosynthesis
MASKIRTLLFSTLYPSSARPLHGLFVEARLRELLSTGEVETTVMAPVPWFPSADPRWGEYARMAATPMREMRNGIDVLHPRYPVVPKIGMTVAPLLLASASIGPIRRLIAEGRDFDIIDAHYYYPDGVAAAMLARYFRKRIVVTARGSDINLISHYPVARRLMQWAARHSDASIGVCNALADQIRLWTVPERVHVVRNGVDLQRFRPLSQEDSRRRLRIDGSPLILSVGHLVENKGHALVIDALAEVQKHFPGARLAIVGHGPDRERLRDHSAARGCADRVTLVGNVDHASMIDWYNAADSLVLASAREGWANVLLESLACGTPVVATSVGGSPEVLTDERVGRLVETRDGRSIADSLVKLLRGYPDRGAVRRYAESFSWDSTSRAQLELFRRLPPMEVAAPLAARY